MMLQSDPLPPFYKACSMLVLKETKHAQHAYSSRNTRLTLLS